MKKIISIILISMLAVSLCACGESSQTSPENESAAPETSAVSAAEQLAGAYTNAESLAVTDEVKALVQKATAELDGAQYTPVAYVASQVVAGTNHLILCEKTPVVQNPVTTYAMVTIYEDLQGNAEITEIIDSDAPTPVLNAGESLSSDTTIDWKVNESLEISDDAKTAFDKATSALAGAEYEPVAQLSTKVMSKGNVVSGTDYYLLCKATPTVPNAESYYAIIDIFEDKNNSSDPQITNTYEFRSGDAETDGSSQESSAAE